MKFTVFSWPVLSGLVAVLLLAVNSPLMAQQAGASPSGTNYEIRLSTLEDNVRSMNGRLEQIEYAVRRLDQTLQHMQGDYDNRLSHLESVAAAAAAPAPASSSSTSGASTSQASPPSDMPTVNGSLGAVKTQDGRVTGGVNNPKVPALPNTPADYGLTSQEQYDRAFGFLRQANYEDAEKAFKSFIEKNPKDKLIDNAKYWYGETLYVRGRYDESAIAFADAYQQNPQGNKAPDSLLKLAMSLSALDKNQDACSTLLEVKTKYPNASSTVRSRAEEERQKLKCSTH